MNLHEQLSKRLYLHNIRILVNNIQTIDNEEKLNELYNCLFYQQQKVAENAAWIWTHLNRDQQKWLQNKQPELINEVMITRSTTKQRLLMTLLLKQHFSPEHISTDFLDFCLDRILTTHHPTAVRIMCIYLSYQQCKYFPELLKELENILQILSQEPLLPGLRHAQRKILKAIYNHQHP